MHFLIVKKGALGDVVRTSYFGRVLKEQWEGRAQITWLTAPGAMPLLRFNPWIDRMVTSFAECVGEYYDRIYSLDDERETLQGVASILASAITGSYLDDNRQTYTEDAAMWFDMGLLSRFGKEHADRLKKENVRGHAEIHCSIFGVERVQSEFYGDPYEEQWARYWLGQDFFNIAINPFAGGRWPSKELREPELKKLIAMLLDSNSLDGRPVRLVLLGAGPDRERNLAVAGSFASEHLWVADTDASVLRLAAVIGCSDVLISSDSLALHLGIAQHIPFVAFFSPTSAAEIDDFGLGVKVTSTTPDYCSYKSNADNSSLTAERLIAAYGILARRLPNVANCKFQICRYA